MGMATVAAGFDILLTDIGDCYIAEAATEKGRPLLSKAKNAVEADKKDLEKRQKVQQDNQNKLNKHKLKCKPVRHPEAARAGLQAPRLGGKGEDLL